MKKKLFFSIILSIFLLIPFLCQASVIVLTKKTPNYTIPTGSDVQIVGTGVSNQIILESGARAELISFPGQNTIQIQSISDLFTVFCSGKVVTFQGTDGTVLKIPAREDTQIIAFMDRTFELAIYEDNVMINDQVIGVENKSITEMFGGNIGSFRSIETQDIITDDVTGVKYVIGQVMIVPEIGVTYDQLEDVVESFGGTIVGHIQFVELFQVEFPGMFLESLYEILEQLNQNPFVKVAVINTVYSESADQSITENWLSDPWNEDPSEPFSWEIYPGDDVYPTNWAPEGNNAAVESMRMPEAWKIAHDAGMGTVKVGIIDSDFPVRIDVNGEIGINGINGNVIENLHEDLEFVWANQSGRKKEKYQHGHHVAGTIGALNNNVGIRGVAWNPNLYGYRTDHSTSDMLYAICSLILEKKVGLINISMNTPQNNDEEQKSTRDYLREKTNQTRII